MNTQSAAKITSERISHSTKIDVFENAFRSIKEVGQHEGKDTA